MMADPTAIPLHLDPLRRRMSGTAVHGNTPFDVPFISEIVPGLYQGGCADGLLLPNFIQHVVSLYPWEAYHSDQELRSELRVTMYDSESQAFEQVDAIAAWVNVCREDGPTLVHCQAGLNRSSLVVARALTLTGEYAMEADDAIRLIRRRRSPACLCNSSFERWLRER